MYLIPNQLVITHHHKMTKICTPIYSMLLITMLVVMVSPVMTGKVPAIIVFGDSTVDTGNNNGIATVLKSNFEPYGRDFEGGRPSGRFCNGRVPPDFLSEYFGLKKTVPAYLDPMYSIKDFATGVVFASGGTGYDDTTAAVLNVLPLEQEIANYMEYQMRLRDCLGENKANKIISEALYIISIGTNDFLENYFLLPTTRLQYTIHEFEDHLIGIAKKFVEEIYHLGARKISLGGIPPMGCLPLERTINLMAISECNEEYNQVAIEFNVKLKTLINQLRNELPGIRLVFSNPYNILKQMIGKPSLFGFDEIWKACCGTGLVEMSYLCKIDDFLGCLDPNKYIFWDSFHPTEKTNRIISEYLFNTSLHNFK